MITSKIQSFDPAAAAALLERSEGNRKLSEPHVAFLAREMAGGRWALNGDRVRISADGVLIDGHHRLHAVIKAGATVPLEVASGIPTEARHTVDTGRGRTASDVLGFEQFKNTTTLGAATKVLLAYRAGEYQRFTRYRPSHREILAECEANDALLDAANYVQLAFSGLKGSRAVAAFVHVAAGAIDATARDDFFAGYLEGLNLSNHSPAYRLRRVLMSNTTGERRVTPWEQMGYTVRAWNHHLAGSKVRHLKLIKGADLPDFEPLPEV